VAGSPKSEHSSDSSKSIGGLKRPPEGAMDSLADAHCRLEERVAHPARLLVMKNYCGSL